MSFITIEGEGYTLKIHDENLYEFSVKEGAVIDEAMAWEAKKIIENYRPGAKFHVLAEGVGFFSVTKEARALSASKEYSSHMAAVAFHTTNSSLMLLGELYNSINKPAVTTRTFHTKESAMEWLRGLMELSA